MADLASWSQLRRKRVFLWLAVLSTTASTVAAIGGLWWWALLGMTEPVGGALFGTAFAFAVGAAVAWGLWSETDR